MGQPVMVNIVVIENSGKEQQIKCIPDHLWLIDIRDEVDIKFKLNAHGFKFPKSAKDAIEIENNDGQFDKFVRTADEEITVLDYNEGRQWYRYNVTVEREDGSLIKTDPLIINK